MTFEEVKTYIQSECEAHGITFIHAESKTLMIESIESNGAFITSYMHDGQIINQPVLAIGTNASSLETLIHEYCHMQQYLENPEVFAYLDELSYIWQWVSRDEGADDIGEDYIDEALQAYHAIEVDCEKRSVEFHKEWNTGINIEEYIQKSNAYTLFYFYVRENRVWYTPGKEPYHIEEVWRQMPKTFDFNVMECYDSVHKLFDKCI